MLAEERRLRTVELLRERESGIVSVTELSDLLGVSSMTIRRDLDWLEEIGMLRRVHGGAVAIHSKAADEKSFAERHREFSQEKQAIGWAAAQLINDGEKVILDAGTTTQQIARNLTGKQDLTVITNALPVADELSHCPQVSTIVLGGILKRRELCTVGPLVTQELARLSVDKLFLSITGFTVEKGATDPDLREAEVKQAMIRAARQVIMVGDSSKWGVVSLMQVVPLRAIHRLVTDDGIPPEGIEALEAAGVAVLTPNRLTAQAMAKST
jgi:DeoR family fructose operon transcriptional repressor